MGKINFLKVFISIFFISQFSWAWNLPDQIQNSEGQVVKLEKDHVLLYFWATWCPDCKHSLQTVLPQFPKDSLQIIAVNTDTTLKNIEEYRQTNKVNIVSIADEDKKIRKEFKVFSVPTGVLLKKDKDQWVTLKTYIGDEVKAIPQDLPVAKPVVKK